MDPRRYKAPPPYYCKVLNLESTAVAGVRVLSEYARKKENAVSCHVIGRLPDAGPRTSGWRLRLAFGFDRFLSEYRCTAEWT